MAEEKTGEVVCETGEKKVFSFVRRTNAVVWLRTPSGCWTDKPEEAYHFFPQHVDEVVAGWRKAARVGVFGAVDISATDDDVRRIVGET